MKLLPGAHVQVEAGTRQHWVQPPAVRGRSSTPLPMSMASIAVWRLVTIPICSEPMVTMSQVCALEMGVTCVKPAALACSGSVKLVMPNRHSVLRVVEKQ